VVVVTWNGAHLLEACLASVRAQTVPHRVVVVDNASTDGTRELLDRRYPDVDVVRLNSNTGFAGGAQAGLAAASTRYTAFLNNDACAEPGWLDALERVLADSSDVVAATSKVLLSSDGHINNAGGALTAWGAGYDRGFGHPDGPEYGRPVDVAAFCGAAAAVRTEDARRVGGFPAEFFLYYEDTDLSWRLGRSGGRIRYVPEAVVHHLHSATTDQGSAAFAFYNQRNQLLMLLRNAPWPTIARALGRYLGVTVVRAVPPTANGRPYQMQPRHRLRALRAVAAGAPAALRARRSTNRGATVSAGAFARRWLGTEAR
jgi:GT2 family glycosyltransferase